MPKSNIVNIDQDRGQERWRRLIKTILREEEEHSYHREVNFVLQ
jgi:hypothetical protein